MEKLLAGDVNHLVQLGTTALGYTIMVASLMLKVPQILAIVRSGSVRGLSFSMYILELVGYTISLAYNYNNGYEISTYGEYVPISVQNIIIIGLLFSYTKQLPIFVALMAVEAASVYVLFSGLVSMRTQEILQASTIAIFSVSKIPQIYANFKARDVGQLSSITVLLQFGGSMARVLTTVAKVPDPTILLGFVIGAILNGTLLAQVLIFGSKPIKAETKKTK
eukprot:TRINITY_DN21454_c0_g1_i1.p1 TRINITY_DN21454_c0_g1~~TRINITY_DN21454_c0_g1_i1.p1  ORF type:complete len:222 (+),score=65.46 TRINITY_DN21454_c0_g1_i1:43-708(+)